MSKPLSFQEVIMRLDRYWADYGCLIWQPYSEKLGAGTANPATTLRVLGPEPERDWRLRRAARRLAEEGCLVGHRRRVARLHRPCSRV